MTIAVLYTAYNTHDLIGASLTPWIGARHHRLDGHTYLIVAVNTPFVGFENLPEDGTRRILQGLQRQGEIDHLITSDEPMTETAARTAALTWARDNGADLTIQVDSDEVYTPANISSIFRFVEANPFIVWFRLSLRNAVFNDRTYLTEPFTPPRIHRIRPKVGVLTFEASCFLQDNDVGYAGGLTRNIKVQGQFAHLTIPQNVAWIKHLTWLNDDRSRRKIDYQLHGRGWPACSFAWDDAQGGLIWNGAPQETVTDA